MRGQKFVHPLSPEERKQLEKGLRSSDAFVLRRCQILLVSAEGKKVTQIANQVKCVRQTVHNVIDDFEQRGLECLKQGSTVRISVEPILTAEKREQMQAILHQNPRNFGKAQSTWTLGVLAEVCCEQGLSERRLSAPTILDAVVRLGTNWKRAKHWVVSPDPKYVLKKTGGTV